MNDDKPTIFDKIFVILVILCLVATLMLFGYTVYTKGIDNWHYHGKHHKYTQH